jgi:hypothetical protein
MENELTVDEADYNLACLDLGKQAASMAKADNSSRNDSRCHRGTDPEHQLADNSEQKVSPPAAQDWDHLLVVANTL